VQGGGAERGTMGERKASLCQVGEMGEAGRAWDQQRGGVAANAADTDS
jgi:hypothetical protein